ncbi:MAG: protein translocase subunit SecD [Candidatus Kerfeldbacteria bacterium]|nr:protein translocase subunit SecD [Candidatus Kerfeldbacteria bacterium]
MRKRIWLSFISIIAISILAGLASYPNGPDISIGNYFREVKVHLGLDLQGGTQLVYNADTSAIATTEQVSALDGVRDVVERRVNALGVSEPVVQTNQSGDQWRVIVELAGIHDVQQAIDTIGETPLLEFREQKTKELTSEEKAQAEASNAAAFEQAKSVLADALKPDADFAALANQYSQDPGNTDQETGEKRGGDLDFFTREVMVAEFADVVFDKLEVGQVYPDIVESEFGYHIIKKTDARNDEARASHILFAKQSVEGSVEWANTELSGKNLDRAIVTFDQTTNQPQVSLEFDSEGAKLFEDITARNVNQIVGIFLDGSPISLPRVNQAISGGSAVITGDFTLEDSRLLAQRLNAGALPVPIALVSQSQVGATLGTQSVEKSFFAGIAGILLVVVFMIAYYRLPGLIASIALVIYALITLALFKLIPITLTLAGVAGFILSVGMAVDANVLIFERSREELRNSRGLFGALEAGFARAWPSIRDSNISTLITCAILGWFGTSVVQGFAITLGLGVLISMFSAITVSHTFLRVISGPWFERHPKLFINIKHN